MSQINGYKEELHEELQKTDPNSHASRLLAQEIERLEKGEDRKDRVVPMIDVHPQQPQPVALKVRIPVIEYPKFNFVGKLLGPKGNTLKRLQETTGTKMSILGKGSMRDKQKEEECRKEGGKYAHLNDELHVYIEVFAEIADAYTRLSHAVAELKKFLVPDSNDDIRQQQLQELMYINSGESPAGPPRGGGRGGFRGARGGPGGPPGPTGPVGRGVPPPASARGAPVRGAPGRGAAPPPPRGAPPRGGRGRGGGAPPPPQSGGYDEFSSRYDDGYENSSFTDQGYGQGDGQYYDYGNQGSGAYDDYSSYNDYGDSWGTSAAGGGGSGGPIKQPARGAKARTHPYSGRGGF
ncbi:KH domain-containing, RNA-binding, signal transduction-associated protein 1-like [Pomacea canaliculata]|uniref:KH domain-containing, RNA-binding, signal transduction-associated protein 1-like n=1 Tax=Pomacea canaliculata TaxID=400727 RepID=UPI000D73FE50|nr:KH domain-containing, RNA-binding, signal transduction-associated protein 1-like [Pomacea canaliculata]